MQDFMLTQHDVHGSYRNRASICQILWISSRFVFGCYSGRKHYTFIIRENLLRTRALSFHYNYLWFPLHTVRKSSESLLSE